MATNLDLLNTTLTNLITQLNNISISPKPTYSIDGQSVSWESYYRMLLSAIELVREQIQVEGGPTELQTQANTSYQ